MTSQTNFRALISYKWLLLILAVACTLRLAWWLHAARVISLDGAEYLCGARSLVRGDGLVGCYEGPELMYAPLYSLLTAGVSLVVRDVELAAHVVSLLFGTALVLPVFFIALLVYGRRAAYIGAVLTAVQPVLVKIGGSTYNESVYMTLFMTAIWSGLRAMELQKWRYCWLTGVLFALACLTRPEAFAYPIFFAVALCAVAALNRKPVLTAGIASILVLLGFLAVVSPYMEYFYAHTGQLRLEGKWDINFTIGNRIQEGMDYSHAAYALGNSTQMSGPLLNPSEFAAYTPFRHHWRDALSYMIRAARINRFDVYKQFESYVLGDPLVFVLCIIALFRKSWSLRRLQQETVLLVMALSLVILMLTAQHVEPRYVFPLLPLLALWTAKGIDELGQWARGLVAAWKIPWPAVRLASVRMAQVSALASVVLLSFYGSRNLWEFTNESDSDLPVKAAGLWLNQYDHGKKRVASWDSRISWYGDAAYLQFPNADPARTLQYFDTQKPQFICLTNHYPKPDPTMDDWLAHGIPDNRAHLIYSGGNQIEKITIYRWAANDMSARRR
jgi:4-amino-4-deoxy-L-arabinose transferase-like glycosyltransferase